MRNMEQQVVKLIPRLRRYAHALWCGDTHAADDLVQDCLERALGRIRYWQPGSDLRAWLFTIMHNLYVNKIRQIKNCPTFIPLQDELIDNRTSHPEQGLIMRDLIQGLMTLSHDQREILLLVTLEGMQYEQVAKIFDVPVGTIMSRLFRARKQLRTYLSDERKPHLKRVK